MTYTQDAGGVPRIVFREAWYMPTSLPHVYGEARVRKAGAAHGIPGRLNMPGLNDDGMAAGTMRQASALRPCILLNEGASKA